jgi:hypothetical protein
MNVLSDLLSQGFNGRKPDLPPQAVHEEEFDLGLCGQFDGMEVQQVGLDSE